MQSFDTGSENPAKQGERAQPAIIGRVEELQPGQAMTVQVANFGEVTLYNVNGDFYATESLCPHQGAPLGAGALCGPIVECFLHGWKFDVRTGECLTVSERLKTFRVSVEGGMIKLEV